MDGQAQEDEPQHEAGDTMAIFGLFCGIAVYFVYRSILTGFYTVRPNERAVITVFGKARRLERGGGGAGSESALSEEEKERYNYPRLRTISPGGPYFKWPWMKVHKVDIQTQALDLTWEDMYVPGHQPSKAQRAVMAQGD